MSTLAAATVAIVLHCAGGVDPDLLAGFATIESASNPLVIHQNIHATPGIIFHPKTLTEAVRIASSLIAAGQSIDTGTFQINSANLDLLEISLADTFDTCRASAAAARLIALMSRYNSGSPTAALAYAKRVAAAVHAVKAGTDVRSSRLDSDSASDSYPNAPPPPPEAMHDAIHLHRALSSSQGNENAKSPDKPAEISARLAQAQ